ncbi:MAG TPA: hypothetical protein VF637_03725 [Sphingomicrobium sp.]
MESFYQADYFLRREEQQRALAAKASLPDTVTFHSDLANHYARLYQEALTLAPRSQLQNAFE